MVLYVLYRNPQHDMVDHLKHYGACYLSPKCYATSDFIHLAVALTP